MPYNSSDSSVFNEPGPMARFFRRHEATDRSSSCPTRVPIAGVARNPREPNQMVELTGFEPATSALQGRRSPN
jgi:hypothetical protein